MSHHRPLSSQLHRAAAASLVALAVAACGPSKEHRHQDSVQAAEAQRRQVLATTLAAQKDSLTQVVLDADNFISKIDSQISKVKGLPKHAPNRKQLEGPLEEQIQARKDLLNKVDALVARARTTAAELAASRRRELALRGQNDSLRAVIDKDEQMIAQLGETIQRQTATIGELHAQIDSLTATGERLQGELTVAQASGARGYVIVGSESELLQKGVVVKEGGMNLLVGRVGKTLQPARKLDRSLFKPIDTREVKEIVPPDTTREYAIVSRQTLDAASANWRDNSRFKGALHIDDADRFWGPSRYLIIVEK